MAANVASSSAAAGIRVLAVICARVDQLCMTARDRQVRGRAAAFEPEWLRTLGRREEDRR